MQKDVVVQRSLVELVEQRILNMVRTNSLSIGDSLPGELELTAGLGVSRSVVREALSRLRMLGLLESKKKRGMIIAEPDVFGGCKQILDRAFLNDKTKFDLYEIRLTLEIGLSDLLFMRKTDKDLLELEHIVNREAKAGSEQTRVKFDIEFHKRLYHIAGNKLLLRFQDLLEPFFRDAVRREEESGRQKGDISHRDLLEELRDGTPHSFQKKMREHLQPHFARLTKK